MASGFRISSQFAQMILTNIIVSRPELKVSRNSHNAHRAAAKGSEYNRTYKYRLLWLT